MNIPHAGTAGKTILVEQLDAYPKNPKVGIAMAKAMTQSFFSLLFSSLLFSSLLFSIVLLREGQRRVEQFINLSSFQKLKGFLVYGTTGKCLNHDSYKIRKITLIGIAYNLDNPFNLYKIMVQDKGNYPLGKEIINKILI